LIIVTPEEFLNEYVSTSAGHGMDHLLSMIAEEAVYWFSDGTQYVGQKAVEAAIHLNFESIKDETYAISEVKWLLKTKEAAVCIFKFTWSGIVRGESASGEGRGTAVLKHDGDSWQMIHEHLSKGEHTQASG
jgi:ketosteroid isomerase-like protein